MSATDPRQDELVGEIRRQREELVAAVSDVRRDVHRELAALRTNLRREVPKVAIVLGLVVAVLAVRRIERARQRRKPLPVVRLRLGRYALLEQR